MKMNVIQDTNSNLANQINSLQSEAKGLRAEYTNRARDWSPDQRREGDLMLDRYTC